MTPRPALTEDQRWLLRAMGGWAIRDCLLGPDGVAHLMQSQWGGSGRRLPGGPEWLAYGFDCGRGKIVTGRFGGGADRDPVVTITAAQLNRYARNLPRAVTDELREVRRAWNAEYIYGCRDWCHCGHEDECQDGRHHPTDDEIDNHYRELRRIKEREGRALDRALGFVEVDEGPVIFEVDESTELVGQLALFAVAS
ncbi:hypothetical protein ACPCIR_12795 [Mycobacterium sp. NPDC051198]